MSGSKVQDSRQRSCRLRDSRNRVQTSLTLFSLSRRLQDARYRIQDSSVRFQGFALLVCFYSSYFCHFFKFTHDVVDDAGVDIAVGIASSTVEAALDVGGIEVGKDIGKVLGKAFLIAVGTEESKPDKSIAQVFPFPTGIVPEVDIVLLFIN